MNKKILILSALTAALLFNGSASAEREEFDSIHAPLNPSMASREEMDRYRHDVDVYVADVEEEISRLRAMRNRAIRGFNKAAREYNNESFFHKDRVPFYPYRRRESCRTCYDDDDWRDGHRREQTRCILDSMMDWGK